MDEMRAAGGLIVDLSKSKPRYLVVHRPALDEWTFPNAVLAPHETHRDAALRAVQAQTGFECEILRPLEGHGKTRGQGPSTGIRYWLMERIVGDFEQNHDVDAIVWMKRSQVMSLLSYVHDQKLLAEAHLSLADWRSARAEENAVATNVHRLAAAV